MLKFELPSGIKRLRNRYRLVIMNDDTYEEVVTFRLSRLSVYTAFSMVFVILVGLTAALIVFTPLKYYIPGAGSDYASVMALKRLQYRVDSVAREDALKNQYILGLKKALSGNSKVSLDTSTLEIPATAIMSD
jgi:uncharacterized membrane protein